MNNENIPFGWRGVTSESSTKQMMTIYHSNGENIVQRKFNQNK